MLVKKEVDSDYVYCPIKISMEIGSVIMRKQA
jgi:hypothetical protein